MRVEGNVALVTGATLTVNGGMSVGYPEPPGD